MYKMQRVHVVISMLAVSVIAAGCASTSPNGKQAAKNVAGPKAGMAKQQKAAAAPTKPQAAPATKSQAAPATKPEAAPAAKTEAASAAKPQPAPAAETEAASAAKPQPATLQPTAATSVSADVPPQLAYYVMVSGGQKGPFDWKELKAGIATCGVRAETLTWRRGMDHWAPAAELDELRGLLADCVPLTDMPPPLRTPKKKRRSRSKRSR